MLFISEHDFHFIGVGLSNYASAAAVNLIGGNEAGLTLSRQAVWAVMGSFLNFFDPDNRRYTYPVARMLGDAKTIVKLVISDAVNAASECLHRIHVNCTGSSGD